MNKNAKLLPQLNQLFLQKQSYTSHKKKILQIRMKKPKFTIRQQLSLTHSKKSPQVLSLRDSKISSQSKTPKAKLSEIPPTILQKCQSLGNSFDWMNPYRKKRYFDELKQNQRIKSRIDSSKSKLGKNVLQKQYEKFARIKQRLMKFQVNPQSHKAMLKSQKSLYVSINPKINSPNNKKINDLPLNRKSMKLQKTFQRKQSNFSVFVKKTSQIKQSGVLKRKNEDKQSKPRPLINYSKMQKNLQKYVKTFDRRTKTDMSRVSVNLKRMKTNTENQSFGYTSVDIDI